MTRAVDVDLERAQERLYDIERQGVFADKCIRPISADMEILHAKRGKLDEQKHRLLAEIFDIELNDSLLKNALDKAVRPHCIAWNAQFFTSMRARLPRELRDMVYAQLWDAKTLDKTWKSMELSLFNDQDESWRILHLPHFVNSSIVGPESVLEVVEAWYQLVSVIGSPFHAGSLESLERLVTADAFSIGTDATTLLRELVLEFEIIYLIPPSEYYRQCVRLLHKIKNKSGFKLTIKFLQRRISMDFWLDALESLRPILEVFEEEGASVRVFFQYLHLKLLPVIEYDLHDARKNPSSNWRQEAIKALDSDSRIRARHRCYLQKNAPVYVPEDKASPESSEWEEGEYDYMGERWETATDYGW
ncbi:uncharacterized protein K460DRAFT_341351 [Cucurbitaria berberidis CBS 394.84]|uniref:Uncharacterized protein n=1 Tax=Cucurbitaria berberidis CBS 394.84 TaxID=1168544 RepID=A0A9P4GDQ5_9PLEO|nr:uncharacterized protein K460DRAFT_341351 [Cucurbitaria berberidis CBS 394.84]KAF1843340.1 hypothetical protein K460DRAFT_341351 [Cucurbitaria berberidis CBS 394.84]